MTDDKGSTFNVSSTDQKGGITAGQVNFSPRQRKLGSEGGRTLLAELERRDVRVLDIRTVAGNEEANTLAREIQGFLVENGIKVESFSMGMYARSPVGHGIVEGKDGKVEIVIGVLPQG